MTEWAAKRFWKAVDVVPEGDAWTVKLDGRPVRTPAKAALLLPTQALAEAVAGEWDAQQGTVDPLSMPFTRSANAAIDKVAIQRAEVADMLAAYGDADLLCYRAEAPEELVARQAETWDPYLQRAADELGARLMPRTGLMHESQDPAALAILSDHTHALSDFELAGFHDLVSLSGSLVLGFAAARDWSPLSEIWAASRLDEDWQAEQWGGDDEAEAVAEIKRTSFFHAKQMFDKSGT